MTRRVSLLLPLLLLPLEGVAGTYGSFQQSRQGFTIAQEINVGSYSDHSREGEVLRQREEAIGVAVKPHLAMYDGWYARVLSQKHPYGGWLPALDGTRAKPLQWDYKFRMPGPVWPAPPPRVKAGDIEPPQIGGNIEPPQIYLHTRKAASQLSRGRALVGFALAQAFLGNGTDFVLMKDAATADNMTALVERAARGDSFAGQPALLAALILQARGRQPELEQVAADPALAPDLRLLARLTLLALRNQSLADEDWSRFEEARKTADVRTLWTWALVFVPESEQAGREAELQKRLPLSDSYFYKDFVTGNQD